VRSFACLSARKNISSGDSSPIFGFDRGLMFSRDGDSSLPELESGGSWSIMLFRLFVLSTFGTDFEKNFGIGREDAAGEAWNVGPA